MNLTKSFICILLATVTLFTSCVNLTVNQTVCKNLETSDKNFETNTSSDNFFVINTKTKKFHLPSCYYTSIMNSENKYYFYGTFEDAELMGYSHCKFCGE